MAVVALMATMSAAGQETAEQFSVATLNVDGLPQKILVLKVNPDGPGNGGSARIGKYLMKKGYDLVMLQEDFNFHNVLSVFLEDAYKMDEWSGDLGVEGRSIDFLHLQNHRFESDGLMGCWKNDLTVTPAPRVPWQQNFGKFSHANDEMVTKGFRRYDVTLRDGTRILCYNVHMDASDDWDEESANDARDKAARMAQLTQLRTDVLSQMGTRPVIIVGDLNCLYGRDAVKTGFIDAINDSGLGTIADVWVELKNGGAYPTDKAQGVAAGETLDKILYINPATGAQIKPVAFTLDMADYTYADKPLGDHYPLSATFQVTSKTTAIDTAIDASTLNPQPSTPNQYYNLKGQRVSKPQEGIYIVNGKKVKR